MSREPCLPPRAGFVEVRRPLLPVVISLASLACATTYEPASKRQPIQDGSTTANVVSIRNRDVTIAYHTEGEATFASPRLSTAEGIPCRSGTPERWKDTRRAMDGSPIPLVRQGDGRLEAAFDHGLPGHGLLLDLEVDEGLAQRCLRLPLTPADDEILWTAKPPYRQVGMGLRVDVPFRYAAGFGPGLVIEGRFLRSMGAWRTMLTVGFGWSVCAHDCPADRIATLFGHLDAGVHLSRRFDFTNAALETGAGLRVKGAVLFTDQSHLDRAAFSFGPSLAIRLLFFNAQPTPGFSPPRRWGSGPEISISRRFAYGRAPTGQDTVVGLGWCWIGSPN